VAQKQEFVVLFLLGVVLVFGDQKKQQVSTEISVAEEFLQLKSVRKEITEDESNRFSDSFAGRDGVHMKIKKSKVKIKTIKGRNEWGKKDKSVIMKLRGITFTYHSAAVVE
jgi:hypothetical protein